MPGKRATIWQAPITAARPKPISSMLRNCFASTAASRWAIPARLSVRRRSISAPSSMPPFTISSPAASRGLPKLAWSGFWKMNPISPAGMVPTTSSQARRSSPPLTLPVTALRTNPATIRPHCRQ